MIRRLLLSAALACAVVGPLAAQPADVISEAALLRHISILASDKLQGRKPGTRGGDQAARYIAREMGGAGLEPGAAGGRWFQRVDLVERRAVGSRATFQTAAGPIPVEANDIVLIGRDAKERIADAPLVYGAHGIEREIGDVDVRGAIVLLIAADPKGERNLPSFDERRASLARRGAAAVVTMQPANARWNNIRQAYANGRTALDGDIVPPVYGAIAFPAWSRLLAAGNIPSQHPRALPLPVRAELRVKTAVRHYAAANVVGRISGASRAEEAVLFTAHWDHLGICRGPSAADRICNGAVDNASGVAVMIEAARALARGPKPERSILFVATTAEELGLLGARAFVREPPVPLKSIVADLNLDTVALAPRGAAVAVIGRGMTRLDPLIDATAASLGREVHEGKEANGYVDRQDGWVLMQAGVPAVMLGGAFSDRATIERFFGSRYHGPTDDLDHELELGGAAEDAMLHVALARALADPKRFPLPAR